MLKDINQSIRKKLKNKTKKMMFLAVLFFSFVIIAVNSYNRIEKINMDTKIKTGKLYENIRKKSEMVNMTLYDLKSSNEFSNYVMSLSDNFETAYNRLRLFKDLQKRNTIYGKVGYYLNVTDNKSSSVITPRGTVDKKTFYKEKPRDWLYDVSATCIMCGANSRQMATTKKVTISLSYLDDR